MRKWSVTIVLTSLLSFAGSALAMDPALGKASSSPKKIVMEKAYKLYQANCITCHDGVANPDSPGKTRDDWHIVIKLMHGYGLNITDAEEDILVDYFFTIRKGTEKEAG